MRDLDSVSWIGAPEEVVRIIDPRYLDEARFDFPKYVRNVLAGSQRHGGRFNPRGEFGAIYTTTVDDVAWQEAYNRWRSDGFPGLPQRMGILRILISAGRVADLTGQVGQEEWEIDRETLIAERPTGEQKQACLSVARGVRVICDILRTESARADGENLVLYPDRADSELEFEFYSDREEPTPSEFTVIPEERW